MKLTKQLTGAICAALLSGLALNGCDLLILGQSSGPAPKPEISFIVAEGSQPMVEFPGIIGPINPVEPSFHEPTILFGAKTIIDLYPCGAHKIPIDVTRNGSHIYIALGVPVPTFPCGYPRQDGARGFAPLDLGSGDYTLHIQWNGMTEISQLRITNRIITVQTLSPKFTRTRIKTVEGFRKNTLAYSCDDSNAPEPFCDSLTEILTTEFKLAEFFYPDDNLRPSFISGRYFTYGPDTDVSEIHQRISGLLYSRFSVQVLLADWLADPGRAYTVQ